MIKTQRLDYVKGQYEMPTKAQMRAWHKEGKLYEKLLEHTKIESVLCESKVDVERMIFDYACKIMGVK